MAHVSFESFVNLNSLCINLDETLLNEEEENLIVSREWPLCALNEENCFYNFFTKNAYEITCIKVVPMKMCEWPIKGHSCQ